MCVYFPLQDTRCEDSSRLPACLRRGTCCDRQWATPGELFLNDQSRHVQRMNNSSFIPLPLPCAMNRDVSVLGDSPSDRGSRVVPPEDEDPGPGVVKVKSEYVDDPRPHHEGLVHPVNFQSDFHQSFQDALTNECVKQGPCDSLMELNNPPMMHEGSAFMSHVTCTIYSPSAKESLLTQPAIVKPPPSTPHTAAPNRIVEHLRPIDHLKGDSAPEL
uniref:uncharacterized protein n=1 Tax=Myxine glutinosa TaxID=7769 RepID=UPI00358F7F71